MKKILTLLLSLASLTTTAETLTSPSGNVALDFRLIDNGVPCYSMNYNGEEVIKPSMLGIAMKDHTEPVKLLFFAVPYATTMTSPSSFSMISS